MRLGKLTVLGGALASAAALVLASSVATPATAATRSLSMTGVSASVSADSSCDVIGHVNDTLADGQGAGIRIWINDGGDYYMDIYNLTGNGSRRAFVESATSQSAVSARLFRSDGGVPVAWGGWVHIPCG